MKQQQGFTLIEMMVAIVVMLVLSAAAVIALVQTQQVTQGVTLEAGTQENLRASMHSLVRDLMEAGEGLPPGGISIPNSSSAVSGLNRPGTATAFDASLVVLSGVNPGYNMGQLSTGVDPQTGAVITAGAVKTDVITVLFADNSLTDSSGSANPPYLNQYPVVQAAGPTCNGVITPAAVTLDPACFTMPGSGTQPIGAGNLIMFQNQFGTALEYVTSVVGQTINFATGDPAGLNGVDPAAFPNGTVAALLVYGAVPTVITRVWMVTYYLDSTTNPSHPQLIRQVNYAGYPNVATQTNPPQPIADDIEDLGFTYDIINSTAPAGTYPNGPGDAPQPACWATPCSSGSDTPQQIRAVNVYVAGRSQTPYEIGQSKQFLHNNLSTQVSIRSLAFTNSFNTSIIAPE